MGVQAWITVRGQHIPIMDGESKTQALSNFFKSKRKVARGKRFNKHMDKMDEYAHKYGRQYERESDIKGGIYDDDEIYDMAHADAEIDADDYMEHKYGKNWDKYSKYNIKGRARTRQEINRDTDRFNSNVSKFENKGLSHDDAVTEAEIANNWKNPYKERASSKMTKDYYNDKKYKLKEDKFTTKSGEFDYNALNKWYNSRSSNEAKYVKEYRKLVEKEYNAKTVTEKNKIIDKMNKIYAQADKEGPKSARKLYNERLKLRKQLKSKNK